MTELPLQEFKNRFSTNIAQAEGRITALTGRMRVCREEHTLTDKYAHLILFLVPACAKKSKTRIARKSSYIKVEAPLHRDIWMSFPALPYLHVGEETFHVHQIDMRTLPMLDKTSHIQARCQLPLVACL
jgi:hypothetical protein